MKTQEYNNRYRQPATGLQTYVNSLGNLIMLMLIVMMISCSQELDAPTPVPLETGTLSASKSDVVINISDPSAEAVTFSWTALKNTKIDYKLVLSSGAKSDSISVQTNTVSRKLSNAELNDFLLDKLGLTIGEKASVDVVLHARVTVNDKKASSNKITITVTPSEKGPAYAELWLVGDATPDNWNINDPTQMVNDKSNIFQFKYNGHLNSSGEGAFKIPTVKGSWGEAFYRPNIPDGFQSDLSNTEVRLAPAGSPGDAKWKITNAGTYKILLNISTTDPFIKISPFTPYSNIYLLGDATTAGFDANNPIAMTVDPTDDNIFTWTGPLTVGQLRFPLAIGNLNGNFFVAPFADESVTTATQVTFAPTGTPANNFKVNAGEEGTYKITINQLKETISIVKQ